MTKNRVIGNKNELPWSLPADLKRFRELTTGHPVIMGRTTFDSIVASIGKPLPNRRNIILTRDVNFSADGIEIAHSVSQVMQMLSPEDENFIIGGAQIYEAFLSQTDKIYATEVEAKLEGDAHFPDFIDDKSWVEIDREPRPRDDRNEFDYCYVTYERERQ